MDARPRLLIVGARGIAGSEGGVEKFAEEFVRRLARSCRVTLICLSDRRPDRTDDVELIAIARSNFMHTDKLFYYAAAAWICFARRFDHVVLLGLNSSMLILPLRLAFWRRVNVVVRSGSVDYVLPKWGLLPKLYFRLAERLLRLADLVVAVAPGIQRHLAAKGIRSVVIPNGLSPAAAPRPIGQREPRRIVAVGRVTPQKNYAQLIEAARLLHERDVAVTIIGGADLSPEEARLRELMARLGVANVTFVGVLPRSRVLEQLSAAALFVNCSVHEGMSNSVLEAIQQGTPIVLSDIEANRDFNLTEAFYVDPRSPLALAERIEQALAAPAAFVVARERFDDWDDIVEKYRLHMALPVARALAADSGPVVL